LSIFFSSLPGRLELQTGYHPKAHTRCGSVAAMASWDKSESQKLIKKDPVGSVQISMQTPLIDVHGGSGEETG
jgi:hypothetical protein